MRSRTAACVALMTSLITGTAMAQTASSADRDTTVQTGGPNGTSGAVGPNDTPSGANKDGTSAATPTSPDAKPAHHHRSTRRAPAPPSTPG